MPNTYGHSNGNFNSAQGYDQNVVDAYLAATTERPSASYYLDTPQRNQAKIWNLQEDIASSFDELSGSNINAFNRYRTIFPGDEIDSFLTFIFIVKPDLNMVQAINEDPFFAQLYDTDPNVIRNLTYCTQITDTDNAIPASTDFISFLYDRTLSYQIPDFAVKNYTLEQPYTGYKTTYAGNSNESRSGWSCSMRFRENAKFQVTKLFEAWVRYMDLVSYGSITPYREYSTSKLLYGVNEIDYATSVYEIITKPDATTILYMHKQTGLIPTGVPHSNWAYNYGSDPDREIDIQFDGGMPEAMTPRIIADFNYNAGMYSVDSSTDLVQGVNPKYSGTSPARHARIGFESEYGGSTLVSGPYIAYNKTRREFKLKWRQFEGRDFTSVVPSYFNT